MNDVISVSVEVTLLSLLECVQVFTVGDHSTQVLSTQSMSSYRSFETFVFNLKYYSDELNC